MSRIKIQLTGIEVKQFQNIFKNPNLALAYLESYGLMPNQHNWCITRISDKNIDYIFTEDKDQYFNEYQKILSKKEDYLILSFSYVEEYESWVQYEPPPLIGTNFKTRLR